MTDAEDTRVLGVGVEAKAIDFVPPAQRHGRANSLLTFWFASNMQLSLLPIGAVAAAVGLNVEWAIIAIVIGNLVGALFMAYHSVQGPRMGVPQMIQSRAQFGMWGALLPLVIVVFLYLGYFMTGGILGGEALSSLLHVSIPIGIVIANALCLIIAWVGYKLFHSYDRVVAVLSLVIFAIVTVKIIALSGGVHVHATGVNPADILLVVAVAATGQITWAPYVSDYSRYLPEGTSSKAVFWYTYIGSAVGGSWMECIGGVAAVLFGAAIFSNVPAYFSHFFPAVAWLFLVVFILGAFSGNFINLYGGFLTILTCISPTGKAVPGWISRIVLTSILAIIGTVVAILASSHILTVVENFLLLTLYFIVPWTAINLTDYYLVRRGKYAIGELFKGAGAYGQVNWPAIGIYVATIAVEVPFVNTTYFTGPVATLLGGGDISWIVGFLFAAAVYYGAAQLGIVGSVVEG